jgi:hypothetical protein
MSMDKPMLSGDPMSGLVASAVEYMIDAGQRSAIGNTVLEAGRYEGGDRQYESDNLVGDRPARIRKPNRQADEQVTQNALEEQRHDIGLDLSGSRIQDRQPNAATVHVKMM